MAGTLRTGIVVSLKRLTLHCEYKVAFLLRQ